MRRESKVLILGMMDQDVFGGRPAFCLCESGMPGMGASESKADRSPSHFLGLSDLVFDIWNLPTPSLAIFVKKKISIMKM